MPPAISTTPSPRMLKPFTPVRKLLLNFKKLDIIFLGKRKAESRDENEPLPRFKDLVVDTPPTFPKNLSTNHSGLHSETLFTDVATPNFSRADLLSSAISLNAQLPVALQINVGHADDLLRTAIKVAMKGLGLSEDALTTAPNVERKTFKFVNETNSPQSSPLANRNFNGQRLSRLDEEEEETEPNAAPLHRPVKKRRIIAEHEKQLVFTDRNPAAVSISNTNRPTYKYRESKKREQSRDGVVRPRIALKQTAAAAVGPHTPVRKIPSVVKYSYLKRSRSFVDSSDDDQMLHNLGGMHMRSTSDMDVL